MKNILYYSNLYDYYGSLLTNTQIKYFEEYYFNNLSLQEIADIYEVSKNAISKTLIDITNKLTDYEKKLKLYQNRIQIKKILEPNIFEKIEDYI
ncbi:MAG: hypothetical protein PHX04_04880 [Bacilli bacterium]|nr:hypothetical protein [Bacilli bacterium]